MYWRMRINGTIDMFIVSRMSYAECCFIQVSIMLVCYDLIKHYVLKR